MDFAMELFDLLEWIFVLINLKKVDLICYFVIDIIYDQFVEVID